MNNINIIEQIDKWINEWFVIWYRYIIKIIIDKYDKYNIWI